jgi:hypothetical protein
MSDLAMEAMTATGADSDESTLRSKDIMKVFHLISRPTLMLMKVL